MRNVIIPSGPPHLALQSVDPTSLSHHQSYGILAANNLSNKLFFSLPLSLASLSRSLSRSLALSTPHLIIEAVPR